MVHDHRLLIAPMRDKQANGLVVSEWTQPTAEQSYRNRLKAKAEGRCLNRGEEAQAYYSRFKLIRECVRVRKAISKAIGKASSPEKSRRRRS